MASGEKQSEEGASIQDVRSQSTLSASANAFVPAAIPESSNPTALSGDPEATAAATLASTSATSKKKRWPAYFFPSLATQRMAFCLDVLKREDIKSVCEFGCGEGAVLRPMTNGASHIDSFPEAMFDEASLLAEEEEEDEHVEEAEGSLHEVQDGEARAVPAEQDASQASLAQAESPSPGDAGKDDDDSIAPSESASRRHSIQEDVAGSSVATTGNSSDSRGRSPPRGRSGPDIQPSMPSFNPARRSSRSSTPEPVASTSKLHLNTEILEKYKQLPGPRVQDKELHLRRIAGLDLTEDILLEAIEATAPPPEEPSPFLSYYSYSNRDRWEDLRVELWQGSLDVYNDALDNFEAFVMTEVIEHLFPKQLDKFPEILFGNYRPRIIVVTTPNYDFNQYFSKAKPPSSSSSNDDDLVRRTIGEKPEDETKNSFKDPTGRTDRYFRDSDHKFEWTEKEFKDWCEMITSKYDYTVEYSGVGSLRNYLGKSGMHALRSSGSNSSSSGTSSPPPPHIQEILDSVDDPSKVFATQTAVFRRKFAYESERSPRSPIQMPLAFYGVKPTRRPAGQSPLAASTSSSVSPVSLRKSAKQRSNAQDTESDSSASRSPDKRHKLLKAHYFKAHAAAGNPKSSQAIRRLLDDLMRERMKLRSVSLRELWGRNEVAQACGGYINKLVQALIKDASCSWDIDFHADVLEKGGEVEDAVMIILKNFEEPERQTYPALTGAGDDDDDDTKDSIVRSADSDSDDDEDDTASRADRGNKDEWQTLQGPPKLSKKQKKMKRMEEAPFLAPIFPIEKAPVWMPEKGSEEAAGWEEWTAPARASTMITEHEWAEETGDKAASGWD